VPAQKVGLLPRHALFQGGTVGIEEEVYRKDGRSPSKKSDAALFDQNSWKQYKKERVGEGEMAGLASGEGPLD
jgi:hypothetical protein